MGKLICIEAGDGSGKETQANKLLERLKSENYKVRKVSFPNYGSESSSLIKMYLRGEFGSRPEDISPYVASTFYAVDRYASYKKEWESFYKAGGIILADRYTTSNMVHQAVKIKDPDKREAYLDWLWNFEFDMFGLPEPDCVIFLDMPPEYAARLMENRKNKITGSDKKDIHERDKAYLEQVYKCALWLADKYGWHKVSCVQDQIIRPISDIHEEIFETVKSYL
ncbi:MAG: thymidylate kinase [Clostridiales bacterium]|jgi:dTMP kinase|nr:thymidylate kinase [Clostridiales bacterium]